ncbi:hypothetical protein [Breznakia pachnodae]|uniref:Uncharacterized protein n=1 Tax=Breznakia pachnodae TaxID=265178 RepID=A0ABU0E3W1_9FIRM|nr:hypothetical protein [Breznakia pachnodae]MDQ0361591.1 hypothetical protein [Breznakia pachnodae]
MKKIKKVLSAGLALIIMFGMISSVSAATGFLQSTNKSGESYIGNNKNLQAWWNTSWNLNGDYLYAKLTGYGNQKRVYARLGTEGTTSAWYASSSKVASVQDVGPWGGSVFVRFDYK